MSSKTSEKEKHTMVVMITKIISDPKGLRVLLPAQLMKQIL